MKFWGAQLSRYVIAGAFILFLTISFFPDVSLAQTVVENQVTDFGVEQIDENINLSNNNLILIITRIIRVVLGLLGIIVLGLMLYAGFVWMTSQGQEDRIATAKRTLLNATIGLAIIFSAFAIVQFVINALTDGNGRDGGNAGGNTPEVISFAGSGSLGSAVLDHYPFRGQTNVARNTKITITFREDIAPSSTIFNTNGTCMLDDGTITADPSACDPNSDNIYDFPEVFGDCLESEGADFDWQALCDHLNTSTIQIQTMINEEVQIVEAAALAAFTDTEKTRANTFVFRPFEPLGNAIEPVNYDVRITNRLQTIEGFDVFRNSRFPYYEWSFETGTTLDTDPPVVVSTYPNEDDTIYKNHIIQITFDEPMDPIMVQGIINSETNPFTHIIFDNTDIEGRWQITNGYRTIEFIPSTLCGTTNSCGEEMYCLPVTCSETGCETAYTNLTRTAQVFNSAEPWEAFPFSGVMDMAGNSLDGDNDGNWDGTPGRGTAALTSIAPAELGPDNYFFNFTVRNEIDRRTPYPHSISPEVDAIRVTGSEPVEIVFSMPMLYASLTNIFLEEYPANIAEDSLWYVPRASSHALDAATFGVGADGTRATLNHRNFGPDGVDLYYFVSVSGTVRGINQNCMYPGRGPSGLVDGTDSCIYQYGPDGAVIQNNGGCIDFSSIDANNDTGCAYEFVDGAGDPDQTQASVSACIQELQDNSPT